MSEQNILTGSKLWWEAIFRQGTIWRNIASQQSLLPVKIFCSDIIFGFLYISSRRNIVMGDSLPWTNMDRLKIANDPCHPSISLVVMANRLRQEASARRNRLKSRNANNDTNNVVNGATNDDSNTGADNNNNISHSNQSVAMDWKENMPKYFSSVWGL